MQIQNEAVEFEENMPLEVFKKSDLIAFRGSDRYCFNIIELTNDIDFKKMTPRSKVKGNILILDSIDEEDVEKINEKEIICNLLKKGNLHCSRQSWI